MWLRFGLVCIVNFVTAVATQAELIITPYINQGRIEEVRNLSIVDPNLFLNFKSYSGFITFDELYNSNTFFWYFPVSQTPVKETPWILWLQGSPGITSLAGLFDEIGPFEYNNMNKKIIARKFAWTTIYSVVFMENPVGAGFSSTNSEDGYVRDVDSYANYVVEALRQFLIVFKELVKAPLYIAGESYAGIYLPTLGLKIHYAKEVTKQLDINFKGIIMGNPLMNRKTNYSSDHQKWNLIFPYDTSAVKPLQDAYMRALKNRDVFLNNHHPDNIVARLINNEYSYEMLSVMQNNIDSLMTDFVNFINQQKIKHAIHAGNRHFSFMNATVRFMMATDFFADGNANTMKLLDNYKVLIYCGVLDIIIPCLDDALYRQKNLNWKYVDDFLNAPRELWWLNLVDIGFVKRGGHLTEVMMLGVGDMVSLAKPSELFYLIKSFVNDTRLPVFIHIIPKSKVMTLLHFINTRLLEGNYPGSLYTHNLFMISSIMLIFVLGALYYMYYLDLVTELIHIVVANVP